MDSINHWKIIDPQSDKRSDDFSNLTSCTNDEEFRKMVPASKKQIVSNILKVIHSSYLYANKSIQEISPLNNPTTTVGDQPVEPEVGYVYDTQNSSSSTSGDEQPPFAEKVKVVEKRCGEETINAENNETNLTDRKQSDDVANQMQPSSDFILNRFEKYDTNSNWDNQSDEEREIFHWRLPRRSDYTNSIYDGN